MQLTVNGSPRECAADATVAQLLDQFDLAAEQVAVELNGHILDRAAFAATRLQNGDSLEIVRFVGGG